MRKENHYMLREIREEPEVIRKTLEKRENFKDIAKRICENEYKRVIITGCGTSFHAGIAASYILSEVSKNLPYLIYASELIYSPLRSLHERDLLIAISQSGETIDVIDAAKMAKEKGVKILGITNFKESKLAKISDYLILTEAGEERAIVATKTYIAQLVALYAFSIEYAYARNVISKKQTEEFWNILYGLSEIIEKAQRYYENTIPEIAKVMKMIKHAYILGADITYPIAIEGALKLKEGTLIHAEAFSAAEFLHGPISLLDATSLVLALCPPPSREKAHEIFLKVIKRCKDTNATVLIIHVEKDQEPLNYADLALKVPTFDSLFSQILYAVPCQLLTYYTAIFKGLDPDEPRGLVKVVKAR